MSLFFAREDGGPGLEYLLLTEEPLEVYLPKDHPLAKRTAISPQEIAGEAFLSISGTAMSTSGRPPALRTAIDRYLKKSGVNIKPSHEVDNLVGIMSLIVSTGGVALLPGTPKTFYPLRSPFVPFADPTPKIDLSVGYRAANDSPVLKLFLSRINEQATHRRNPKPRPPDSGHF